ncbi:DNA-directed RNA polymerase subunit beta [Cytobacillus sp. FJAT-54145]|uniref:DNA-directed RNA polymerase subunit beta n=1 Tax=Cytobacillus spartinae TaxID=3299023 RepID=A0ABW6KEY9_9BACI
MALNNNDKEAAQTREQLKKQKEEQKETLSSKRKRIRVRLIPIWLKVFIVAVLLVASVILGAMVGYSVMGEGEAKDIFEKSTWTHIMELVNKEK